MRKVRAWMGTTHTLLSLCTMAVCMMLPFDFFQSTFGVLKKDPLLFIVSMIVLVGAALLPDLDNPVSTAGATLGLLGDMMALFMRSTASIVWNILHTKRDYRPKDWHRYLWHTPIIGISFILLFYFTLPSGEYTIITNISNSIKVGQFGYFLQTNAILVLYIFLIFMAVLVGSNAVLRQLRKFGSIPNGVEYILPILVLVYIGFANYTQLRILGVMFGSGYLMHCLQDAVTDTGVPLLFPIPINGQFWKKIVFPFAPSTGGVFNKVLDFVAFIGCIILFILAFSNRGVIA